MIEQTGRVLPTSDERMMAGLAHFFGLFGSLIVYLLQKDRSRYVRFQAAQALAFDLLTMLFIFGLFFCFFGLVFLGMFGTMFAAANNTTQPESVSWLVLFPFIVPFGMVTCLFPFSLVLFVIRIVATVSVLNGSDFRYPWLGKRVANFLID